VIQGSDAYYMFPAEFEIKTEIAHKYLKAFFEPLSYF